MEDADLTLEVDMERFIEAYGLGVVVLDVRNPDEYEWGHVPGAVSIPLGELAARQDEVPDADPIYVICAGGGRSMVAAKALVDAGYSALSVAGGTTRWLERGGERAVGSEPGRSPKH